MLQGKRVMRSSKVRAPSAGMADTLKGWASAGRDAVQDNAQAMRISPFRAWRDEEYHAERGEIGRRGRGFDDESTAKTP